MKAKKGVSLVALVITIIVMVMIAGLVIMQIDNSLTETLKNDFAMDLTTIKDKCKEYYILTGALPVQEGEQYTANQIKDKHTNVNAKELILNEITENKDLDNMFYVVDLNLLQLETSSRGKQAETNDVFVIASKSLNVYYLKGEDIDGVLNFSLLNLVSQSIIENNSEQPEEQVELNNELEVIKSTNAWSNEISLVVKYDLKEGESLQYAIGGVGFKKVADNKTIVINANSMTSAEKTAFDAQKIVTVRRVKTGIAAKTKDVAIDNLDITEPTFLSMTITDSSSKDYNIIKIESSDNSGSGVKALYYDYSTILDEGKEKTYYTDRSNISSQDVIGFGKATKDGTIKLDKNIKSIVAVAVDNAGNVSSLTTFVLDNTYIISK